MPVANNGDVNSIGVSEHTILLMLAMGNYIETNSNKNPRARSIVILETLIEIRHPFRKDFVDVYIAFKGE